MTKRSISKREFDLLLPPYYYAVVAFKEANETIPEMMRGRLDGDDDMETEIRQSIQEGQPLDDLLEKLNVKVEKDNNR